MNVPHMLQFRDLRDRGIVNNRVTLNPDRQGRLSARSPDRPERPRMDRSRNQRVSRIASDGPEGSSFPSRLVGGRVKRWRRKKSPPVLGAEQPAAFGGSR